MENLRQVLYNFHRNGGVQPCVSITPTVSCSTNLDTNNINNTSTGNLHQHHMIQMPLLGSNSTSSSMPTGVATSISNSVSPTTPLIINQQHVVHIPPSLVGDNNSEVEQHCIKSQAQQRMIHTNMSPMNMPITIMDHSSLDGVVGNGGNGVVAATTGAAGGEGPSSTAASAANKSSDDSSDCQG